VSLLVDVVQNSMLAERLGEVCLAMVVWILNRCANWVNLLKYLQGLVGNRTNNGDAICSICYALDYCILSQRQI